MAESCSWNCNDVHKIRYLDDVANVLAEYSWIYSERNTDIFLHNVLEKIPEEWVDSLVKLSEEEFYQLTYNFLKDDWPDSLKNFVRQCQRLGNLRFPEVLDPPQKLGKSYKVRKASLKKQQEIKPLSHLIHKACQEFQCPFVLDVGSGLGYLDQILHHNYGLYCICLDSASKYTLAAKERLKRDSCITAMKHKTFEVKYSGACHQDLKAILKEDWDRKCNCKANFCGGQYSDHQANTAVLIGLHSCGNLTQDMMKLFCQMEELVAFICVGCCYHKINLKDFPMSKTATMIVNATQVNYPKWHLSVTGLRLAAEGTRSHLKSLLRDSHKENCTFFRALIEYYIKKENITWCQPKRHLRPADVIDFETYCKNMLKDHPLSGDETTMKNLSDLYHGKEMLFSRIKVFLVLQILVQPLLEGFVTVDRMMYFKEQGISTEVIAVWNDANSPRNLALCAYKR